MRSLFDLLPQDYQKGDYEYITEDRDLPSILEELKGDRYIYLDSEVATESFENIDPFKDRIRLLQIGNEEKIYIIDAFKVSKENLRSFLKELLKEKGIIGHNIKFDLKFLSTNFNVSAYAVFDTMIASQILSKGSQSDRHSLKAVSNRFIGEDVDKKLQKSDWKGMNLTQQQLNYAAEDIKVLRKIFKDIRTRLNKDAHRGSRNSKVCVIFDIQDQVACLEMAFLPVLVDIELSGIPVNINLLEDMYKKKELEFQSLYREFKGRFQMDPFSPQQVTRYMMSKLGLELPKTEKGSYSSGDTVLKNYMDFPEIKLLLDIRTVKKVLDKLKEIKMYTRDGRVFGEFKQIGASTGRMSSFKPNLQNIPSDLKFIFQTSEGYKFIIADYSQIELRLAAEYTNDENMIRAFVENKDLHKLTASIITGKRYEEIGSEDRRLAKAINFGLIYGMSPKSLVDYGKSNYGVDIPLEDAKAFCKNFFEYYREIGKWHSFVKEQLKKHRFIEIKTLFGRRLVASRFTDAVNYPIQGSGSDLLKMATIIYHKNKDSSSKIVNLVHDEILIESLDIKVEDNYKLLESSMKNAGNFILKKVPIAFEIKVGNYWGKE